MARTVGARRVGALVLPVVGDPLTLAAGLARVPFAWFLPLVAALRFARYAVLVVVA